MVMILGISLGSSRREVSALDCLSHLSSPMTVLLPNICFGLNYILFLLQIFYVEVLDPKVTVLIDSKCSSLLK